MTPTGYSAERRKLIRALKKTIAPYLRNSGYAHREANGVTRPLKLWVPRDGSGEPTGKTYRLPRGFVVTSFEGFTEEGVITDSYGGGLVTTFWDGMPIEDLFRLQNWMNKMLPPPPRGEHKPNPAGTRTPVRGAESSGHAAH